MSIGIGQARLLLKCLRPESLVLSIDDTVIFRSSKKAPGVKWHHQHGNRPNRPRYVNGQCLVTLAVHFGGVCAPLLHRLMRVTGNTTKLTGAKTLLRCFLGVLREIPVTVLLDAWYMRRSLIEYLLSQEYQVVGNARRDTALFRVPKAPKRPKRGRPLTYGKQFTIRSLSHLPLERVEMVLYGKQRTVEYFSDIVVARFLRGRQVSAVWIRFTQDTHTTQWRLLLATRTDLTPLEVIRLYEQRWSIESVFNELKNRWGLAVAWQQSAQVFMRWVTLLSAAFFIGKICIACFPEYARVIATLPQWRKKDTLTLGTLERGLRRLFSTFNNPFNAPTSGKNSCRNLDDFISQDDKVPKIAA